MLEIVFWWKHFLFLIFFVEALPNNMWWCRCCLIIFFMLFWPRNSIFFCNSPAVVDIDMSSSRQIHNILCWLKILNYCPDGGNGNFHCSSSFLKATLLICEAQLSFAAHQKYIIWFFSLWWMIKGIWTLFPSYLYFCETGSHGWIISCS